MYSARINGEPTTFGTSGLLYRSNKVMYDRVTRTLWSQLLGKPVVGPLVGSGIRLDFFPVSLTTWGDWLKEHPDTTVISLETGYYSPRQYQPEDDDRSIYFDYRANPESMFPVWHRDDRLETKAEVLGLTVGEISKAYPLSVLQETQLVHDQVGGQEFVIIASSNSMDARVYRSDGLRFTLPPGGAPLEGLPRTLADSNGDEWKVTTDALVNSESPSRTLPVRPSSISFWFGWFAFHPDTLLFGDEAR